MYVDSNIHNTQTHVERTIISWVEHRNGLEIHANKTHACDRRMLISWADNWNRLKIHDIKKLFSTPDVNKLSRETENGYI